jgi:hypothetical protein
VQQQAVQELHVRISQCLFSLNAKLARLVPLPESRQIADKPGALAAGVAVAPSQESTPATKGVNSSAVFPFDVIARMICSFGAFAMHGVRGRHQRR